MTPRTEWRDTDAYRLAEEVGRLILASTDGALGLVSFYDDASERLAYFRGFTREITATVKDLATREDKTVRWYCIPDWGAQPIAGWILRETRGGWAR